MSPKIELSDIDATRAAARKYLGQNWTPIAYAHGSKDTREKNWPKKSRDKVNVDKDFSGNQSNVGVVLGAASDDLVDIDLDSPEAIQLAPAFLPPCDKRFGRPSTPDAHWLYKATVPATVQFTINGKKDGMLVELRSTGGQTMFPPSVHPCGERLSWAEDGALAEVDGAELLLRVRRLAVASLILRNWQDGTRNRLGLLVPGALLTHGWTDTEVERLVTIVSKHAGDDDKALNKSLSRIRYTVRRLASGRPCTGVPKLAEAVGIDADTLRSWIDMRPEEERGILKSSDPIYLARQFAKTLADVWHWRGDFYKWSGSWWVLVDDEELKGRLYPWLETVRVMEKGVPAAIRATRNVVADTLQALAGVRQLPNQVEAPFWIDAKDGDPAPVDVIPFKNGMLDLRDYRFRPPDSRLFTLHGVDCSYDAEATAPTWAAFMQQVFPDDVQSMLCVEEILGYCLTGDTSQQKAFAFIGEKRSGKGTIARVLRSAVGASRYANPKLSDFGENFGMENLVGKTVAVFSDARSAGNSNKATENILAVTGEDAQSINRKYKSRWNGVLQTRILLVSNTVLNLKDPTGVVLTRFIVVEFKESFYGREDPALSDKLLAELPGIINVWLEGLQRLRARGRFEQPDSGRDVLDLMDETASPVKRFVEELCVVGPDYEIRKQDLNTELNLWLKDNGHFQLSAETIANDLYGLHMGIKSARFRAEGGKPVPYYAGITLAEIAGNGGKLTPGIVARVYRDRPLPPESEIEPKIPW